MLCTCVYQSDRWRNKFDPKVKSLVIVDRIKVTMVVPPPKSGLR